MRKIYGYYSFGVELNINEKDSRDKDKILEDLNNIICDTLSKVSKDYGIDYNLYDNDLWIDE